MENGAIALPVDGTEHDSFVNEAGFADQTLTTSDMSAVWRNGIANTVAIVDAVRAQFANRRWTGKTHQEFDESLDAAMDAWFRESRKAAPATYNEAEAIYQRHARLSGSSPVIRGDV